MKKTIFAIFWVMLGVAVVRLINVQLTNCIAFQDPIYFKFAKEIFDHLPFTITTQPFYSIVSYLFYLLVNNYELAEKICFILFSALSVIPLYLIGRNIYGKKVGIVAGILTIFMPALSVIVAFYSIHHSLFIFLILTALYLSLLMYQADRNIFMYMCAGILYAFAFETQTEGIVYFGLIFGLIILERLIRGSLFRIKFLAKMFVLAVSFFAVVFSWAGYKYSCTGQWQLLYNPSFAYNTFLHTQSLYQKGYIDLDVAIEVTKDTYGTPAENKDSIVKAIAKAPKVFVMQLFKTAKEFLNTVGTMAVYPIFLFPLIGAGLFMKRWDKKRLKDEAFLFCSIAPIFIFYVLLHIEARYLSPMVPIFILWTANGLVELEDWSTSCAKKISSNIRESFAKRLPLIATLIGIIGVFLIYQAHFISITPKEYKKVGLWLKGRITDLPNTVVIANNDWIHFYSDKYMQYDKFTQFSQVLDELKNGKTVFMAESKQKPGFISWTHQDGIIKGLKEDKRIKLEQIDSGEFSETKIYKVSLIK